MDIELKEKIDRMMNEISNLNDLNQKMELFHYILRQTDYCIWSLEEEQRQFENAEYIILCLSSYYDYKKPCNIRE